MLRSQSLILLICCVVLLSKAAFAQKAIDERHDELKTALAGVSESVNAMPEDAADRQALLKRVKALQVQLEQCELNEKESARLSAELSNAESIAKKLDQDFESAKETASAGPVLDASDLSSLNMMQTNVQAEIDRLRGEIDSFDREAVGQRQTERIAAELKTVESRIKAADTAGPESDASLAGRISSLEIDIDRHQLLVQRKLLQVREQKAETFSQLDIDQKRKDLLGIQLSVAEAKARQVSEAIAQWRQDEAKDQAAQASDKANEVRKDFPQLQSAEEENVRIAEKVQKLEVEAASTRDSGRELQQQLIDIASKFGDTQRKIRDIGRSNTVGAMLRKRKSELPGVAQQQQQADEARDRIEEIQFERFQIAEQLAELSPASIYTELEENGVELDEEDVDNLSQPIENLIQRRRESLRSLDKIYDRLFNDYIEIETANSRVAKLVGQFNAYINERILWLRSNNVLFSEWKVDKADAALVSSEKWSSFGQALITRVRQRHVLFSLLGVGFVALLAIRPRLAKEVDELGSVAGRGSCATFWPTARAAILTTLIAIKIPLFVFLLGYLLGRLTSSSIIYDATAHALQVAGLFAIPIEMLRRTCRTNGLATKHFDWSNAAVTRLKKGLSWYVLPASMLVCLVSFFIQLDTAHRVDLIERSLFVVAMLLSTWLLYQVFSPKHGIFGQYLARNENSWAHQTSIVWFSLILLIPVSLGILTIAGYYYTAVNLARCLCFSFAFAVGIELVRALIRRFVLVRRRAAHIETARRKREAEIEAAREARKKAAEERRRRIDAGEEVEESTTPVMTSESLADLQFENIDIEQNAGQANQLIRLLGWTAWLLGLWLVWSDVLPAMKALDEYKLWGTTAVTESRVDGDLASSMLLPGSTDAAASDSTTQSGGKADPAEAKSTPEANAPLIDLEPPENDGVSLRDFLVFLAIALLTFFAARNLPNAFEMLFLEELPVDRSARYASKALFSYAIVIIGTMLALRTLSINWTSIQWLVTALTFGLAFGLQEIFANFVAGIILMFERPMRIGDLITVDDFTGVVTRIRTRATTIVNWDRKEYVIPNKDFITGRLVNWTLSDAINRIQFTVGIAYGSDVAKAKKIIFDICKEHPSIVDDPPTSITFEEFADSSLNLVVRTFLGTVDSRLPVVDALHLRINNAFNEAGIEIAFPQRDLNLRAIEPEAADLLVASSVAN